MRADRDDTRFTPERRNYTMPIVAGAVVLLAILLFIGLRDSDELIEQPAAVVRDSAIVEPPVIDTTAPAQQQATTEQRNDTVAQGPRGNFNERQLPPPTSTVGAGAAATPNAS
jgi:hypothetical protein